MPLAPPPPMSPTTSTGCSARSRSIRRGSGPAGRSRDATAAPRGSTTSFPSTALDELAWRTRIEGSLGPPRTRVQRRRSSVGRSSTATASTRWAPTSPSCRPTSRTRGSIRSADVQGAALQPRVRGDVRRPGLRRQPRRRRLGVHRLRRRRPTPRLHRRRSDEPGAWPDDERRPCRHRRLRSRRRDLRRGRDRRGVGLHRAREGTQSPDRTRAAVLTQRWTTRTTS